MRGEPEPGLDCEAAQHAAFLAFFRETVIEKCASLPHAELRRPHVPSGWTLLELLQHLAFMERRWFVWGFLGEQVADPWGDSPDDLLGDGEERWFVAADRSLADVVALLRAQAVRTEEILAGTPLETTASQAGRFRDADPPDLRWICFHVLQEYARHTGHVDLAVEIAGGHTGE